MAHPAGRVATYEWPAGFAFRQEPPESGTGKVTKREVGRLLQEDA
jgi:hypothetical protein